MANGSVATPSHSINPVSHLSYLIEAALQDSCNQPSDFHENYRRQFASLVGLSFTAMLAKGSWPRCSQWQLLTFLGYGDNFTQSKEKFEELSFIVAELVCNAMPPFKFLGMPRYFDDFMLALMHIIYPASMELTDKKRNIGKLLQTLFENCD